MKMVIQQINNTGEVYPGQSITLGVVGSYNDVSSHAALTGTSVHGLGTASTANVTTSSTDTTAGRVLKVGDFGLGRTTAVNFIGDLDSFDIPAGLYLAANIGANITSGTRPGDYTGGFQLIVIPYRVGSTAFCTQYAMMNTDSEVSTYYRAGSYLNGWSNWLKVFNSGNIIGTVSQSSGVPTGAVIERGINSNGEYTSFADGTLICTNNNLTLSYSQPDFILKTWAYPKIFTAVPSIFCSYDGNSSDYTDFPSPFRAYIAHASESRISCAISMYPPNGLTFISTSEARNVCAMAIGRWF